jgi:hypothetical protein
MENQKREFKIPTVCQTRKRWGTRKIQTEAEPKGWPTRQEFVQCGRGRSWLDSGGGVSSGDSSGRR